MSTEDRATQEAVADGATALFGEKYGERVRVVSVPGFSMELCGGTHCRATGDIGPFVIVQESGIAAGVRRLEGATGLGALRHVQSQRAALSGVAARLNVPPSQAGDAVDRLQADLKRATRETAQLKMKASTGAGAAPGEISEFGDIRLLTRKVTDLDGAALRELADSLKASLGKGVVILGAASGEKAQFVVSVTSNVTDRLHAGNPSSSSPRLSAGRRRNPTSPRPAASGPTGWTTCSQPPGTPSAGCSGPEVTPPES